VQAASSFVADIKRLAIAYDNPGNSPAFEELKGDFDGDGRRIHNQEKA
jgi:hypothetical protein